MGVAYLQFPWSAQVMDELGAAFDAIRPSVVVTYAEAGGWGRAMVLEARRRGIASAGLQHGFIYRHWLNYLHEADEMVPAKDDQLYHFEVFLNNIRQRNQPQANPETCHHATTLGHLMNIAWETGRTIKWDAAGHRIAGDPEAQSKVLRPYRAPWKLRS